MLSEKDQEFLYQIYLNEIRGRKTLINGEYNIVDKLNKVNLVRVLKMKRKSEKQVILTDDGLVMAVIICRLKGDFKHNRNFAIGYW
jgi:hypothetical protein